jgi:hypothetical protein
MARERMKRSVIPVTRAKQCQRAVIPITESNIKCICPYQNSKKPVATTLVTIKKKGETSETTQPHKAKLVAAKSSDQRTSHQ